MNNLTVYVIKDPDGNIVEKPGGIAFESVGRAIGHKMGYMWFQDLPQSALSQFIEDGYTYEQMQLAPQESVVIDREVYDSAVEIVDEHCEVDHWGCVVDKNLRAFLSAGDNHD